MAATQSQTLLFILTANSWFYDGGTAFLRFFQNGEGEIFDGGELHYKFAKQFEWKTLNLDALEKTVRIRQDMSPQTIAYLSLEITLTERLPDQECWRKALKEFKNEKYPFTEDAYRPQTYTVPRPR
ncbi:uncharacterized protein N7458_001330 [Penicillium daleae]|uniref:Uncharacterized protein n=1 Tax=Penicillium daleae TaxID=63821 RepID=A0AAD6CAY4_9EURO|nr:uncharacterized protein N7458_001330 [Penicillium daleae]KAJ5459778.1 hypothetical protein N7458_001330 [Penicillium daleae]